MKECRNEDIWKISMSKHVQNIHASRFSFSNFARSNNFRIFSMSLNEYWLSLPRGNYYSFHNSDRIVRPNQNLTTIMQRAQLQYLLSDKINDLSQIIVNWGQGAERLFRLLKLITDYPSQNTEIAVRHELVRGKLWLKKNYELNPPRGYLEISRTKTESVALQIIKMGIK